MANRTISLSPIGDLIRKKIVESGQPFSNWVEEALLVYNSAMNLKENEEIVIPKPKVPWHYQCQLCRQQGHHASDCSMYNPVIETEGKSNA
jgi:hypothetical protein